MNLFQTAFDLWRMFDHGSYVTDAELLQKMHEALGAAYADGFEAGYDLHVDMYNDAHPEDDAYEATELSYDPSETSTWYQGIDGIWHEYTPGGTFVG